MPNKYMIRSLSKKSRGGNLTRCLKCNSKQYKGFRICKHHLDLEWGNIF